ncbi:MAG: acyl-CoA thioester hydrolase/BAAT C-terminal domain-containing protein [Candidatus Pelethousia sp.]|nr:acyl-CoA thioester hydrolase/BAAT C-terminal domain-containing protein [Candidatus Pelethousia sp.]
MEAILNAGFQGIFYPARACDKAMIVVTGSDGGIRWARRIAAVFANRGVPALAVAYWGVKGTAKTLSLIPLETIQQAVSWLHQRGYTKVGIYGVSKGAELALTAASLIPEIKLVVAVSPACCVFEGIAKPKFSGSSSWTWQGQALPYASFKGIQTNMVKNILLNREFGFSKQYIEVLATKKEEANTIKVENINGAILLISPAQDAQWPSAQMAAMIMERLQSKGFPFPFHHAIFSPASHILCPVNTPARFAYRIERKHAAACNESREEALAFTFDWIENL